MENNDKDKTLEFKPIEEQREVKRNGEDIYSKARENYYDDNYDEEESEDKTETNSDRKLTNIAIILGICLVAAIIGGIYIVFGGAFQSSEKDNIVVTEEETEKTDEIEKTEEKNETENEVKVSLYNIIFYGDSVIKKGDYYTALADLLDENYEKKDNRKLIINKDTEIRENGKRMSVEALIYLIESFTGDEIIFEGEVDEKDNKVVSISFEGELAEEATQENEEPQEEDIVQEEENELQEDEISEGQIVE